MTTDDASRIVAAGVLVASAMFAVYVARRMPNLYAWHMGFVAVWSLVAAAGMMSLALEVVAVPAFVELLNLSWTLTVTAWTVFVWRLLP